MEMSRTGLTAGELPPVLPLAIDPAVSPSHGTYSSGSPAGVPATAAQCRWIADDIAGEMARFRMFRRSAANSLLKSGGYGALVAASVALRDDADSDASLLNSLLWFPIVVFGGKSFFSGLGFLGDAREAHEYWNSAELGRRQYERLGCDRILNGEPKSSVSEAAGNLPPEARMEPAAVAPALLAAGAALLFAIIAQPVSRLAGFAAMFRQDLAGDDASAENRRL